MENIESGIARRESVLVRKAVLRLYQTDVLAIFQNPEVVPHLSERRGGKISNILPLKDDPVGRNTFGFRPFLQILLDEIEQLSSWSRRIIQGVFEDTV